VIPIKTRIHSDHFQVGGKPIIDDVQDDLNALNHEGWELVSVQDVSLPDGRMFTIAYFKRRKGVSQWALSIKGKPIILNYHKAWKTMIARGDKTSIYARYLSLS